MYRNIKKLLLRETNDCLKMLLSESGNLETSNKNIYK